MDVKPLFTTTLLINVFAYFTIRLRPVIYKTKLFKPMIWNMKLSLLPFAIQLISFIIFITLRYFSSLLEIPFLDVLAITLFFILQLLWLLFLPNAGYLITELNLTHRSEDKVEVPIWYDIVSVLSFAFSGIINTIVNIFMIQLAIILVYDPPAITSKHILLLWISASFINILVATGSTLVVIFVLTPGTYFILNTLSKN